MPRLVKPSAFRVAPTTKRRKRVRASGRVPRVGSRMEPALRVELPGEPPRFAEPKSHTGICRLEKGRREKLCFVKPLFVGRELGRKLGVEPGAYLANCTGAEKKKGRPPQHLIPVRSRRDAFKVARRFCGCREQGGSPSDCATDLGRRVARPVKRAKPRRRR
jgi:hypothetical protein